jgi:hypothetical protein
MGAHRRFQRSLLTENREPAVTGCHDRLMTANSGAAPSRRMLAWLAISGAALGGLDLWLGLDFGEAPWPSVASDVSVDICYVAAGLTAWRLRPRSRTGPWMYAMGTVMLISDLNDGVMLPRDLPGRGLIVLFGSPASWVELAIAGHLVLAYPSGRLVDRRERRLVAAAFVLAAVGGVLVLLTKTPVPICADWCGPSPVQLVADAALYLRIRTVLIGLWIALAVIAVFLLLRRAVTSGPRRRRALGLTALMGSLTAVFFCVSQAGVVAYYAGHAGTAVSRWFALATVWAAVVTVPVAFFIGLLRERQAPAHECGHGGGRPGRDPARPRAEGGVPGSERMAGRSGAAVQPSTGRQADTDAARRAADSGARP